MVKKIVSITFTLALMAGLSLPQIPSPSIQEDPFCPQIANYTIDVRLSRENKTLTGIEYLVWTNSTDIPTDELWFHLYWNGFQNNMSSFLIEGNERWGDRISRFTQDDWGYCRIDSIKTLATATTSETIPSVDLTPTLEFRQPDDDNRQDQTVFTVKLPQPLGPGESLVLQIDFIAKIPTPIHRAGVHNDYYFIAQWFPKIGVLAQGEWNCHQFHATSNFFADYGTYDVKITIPSQYIVGATGELKEKIRNGDGTFTHRFIQHSVHDFAWTASPHFIEHKEAYEFAPGMSTEITLLLQPYHKNLKNRYLQAVKNALKHCSRFYGDYPYSTITCVDPAYNSRSGGMEYPTLFTAGAYFLSHPRIPSPEGVTIHEFGHSYFYGLIGTNEFEDAWMDEGFTSFLDSEVYYSAYPEPLYSRRFFGIPVVYPDANIPIEASGISRHRRTADMDIIQLPTWHFLSRSSYGANAYAKTELVLRTLKRYMGDESFSQMIKEYSQNNWFKHPYPQEFYNIVNHYAEEDMNWFFDQLMHGSERLDYAIGDIQNQRVKVDHGWFGREYKDGVSPRKREPQYLSEVLVRRLGEVKVPVEVLIIFDNGRKIRESWDGQYRWKKFRYQSIFKIEEAVVDPQFKYVLDINRTNNSKTIKPNRWAPLKWVSNWMLWLQHAMEFFTILGG